MQVREQDGVSGGLMTHTSFFNNRIPATFDAREERKGAPMINGVSDTESETFQSDECDEKRSYTPQPR